MQHPLCDHEATGMRWIAVYWWWWSKRWRSWVMDDISEQLKCCQQLPTFLHLFLLIRISLIYYLSGILLLATKTNSNILFKASPLCIHALDSKPGVFFIEEDSCPICIPDSQHPLGRKAGFTLAEFVVQTQIFRFKKRKRHWTLAGTIYSSIPPLNKTIFCLLLKPVMQIGLLCLNYNFRRQVQTHLNP